MFYYYKDLNFKNITSVKYRHLFWVLFWPVYILGFVLTEKFIVPIYDIHSAVDDLIPFCEFFVIPYFLWYGLLAFVSLYGLLFDIPSFVKLYKFLSIGASITFLLYIIFPNMQSLRPVEFARDNIFVDAMKWIYTTDTNTNVCPSFHVVFSMGMLFSMWNSKHFEKPVWRTVSVLLTAVICISTVFLKQHSIIDIYAGLVLSFLILPFIMPKKKQV